MTHMQSFELATLNTPTKILADGTFCKPGDRRTDHVGVLLPLTGIIVHPVSLGLPNGNPFPNWDACDAACRNLQVLGLRWELSTREDWNPIIDAMRYNPAVDTNLYPGIKPRWHWMNSDCAWEKKAAAGRSASAWLVYAFNGHVYYDHRYNSGFALAVSRVGQ